MGITYEHTKPKTWLNDNNNVLKLNTNFLKSISQSINVGTVISLLEDTKDELRKEIDKKLQEYARQTDLDKTSREFQETLLALKFLNEQSFAWRDKALFTNTALMMANNDFNAILGIQDAQKIPWFDILLGVAAITLPHLGAIGLFVKKLGDSSDSKKKFLSAMIQSSNDFVGVGQQLASGIEADSDSLAKSMSSNTVISSAMKKVFYQIGMINLFNSVFSDRIIKDKMTKSTVIAEWRREYQNIIPILDTTQEALELSNNSSKTLESLSKIFLYDMLRAYAAENCDFMKVDKIMGIKILPTDIALPADMSDEFKGISQAARKEIYKRFTYHQWWTDPSRPFIIDDRDILRKWVPRWKSNTKNHQDLNSYIKEHY